jgi:hypothetical protein
MRVADYYYWKVCILLIRLPILFKFLTKVLESRLGKCEGNYAESRPVLPNRQDIQLQSCARRTRGGTSIARYGVSADYSDGEEGRS